MKHGFGELIHANGDIVKGRWENDRLNGVATIIRNDPKKKDKSKTEHVIFKDD